MRFSAGALVLVFAASWLLLAQSTPKPSSSDPAEDPTVAQSSAAPSTGKDASTKWTYGVEWRLIRAGMVTLEAGKKHGSLHLESAGIVSTLFKVEDVYLVDYDPPYCATASLLDAVEGKHHRESKVTYDRSQNHAFFIERDLIRNTVIRQQGVDTPHCVADAVGGLMKLRDMHLEPGQSAQIAVSDGRRSAPVKVEAQAREQVKTAMGTYDTIRYEAHLLNGVVYSRKGRTFLWITDDARRLPVQIRLRLSFPIGTVTLQLEKEDHS
jgi:Protein of unknown function (DUF3108)